MEAPTCLVSSRGAPEGRPTPLRGGGPFLGATGRAPPLLGATGRQERNAISCISFLGGPLLGATGRDSYFFLGQKALKPLFYSVFAFLATGRAPPLLGATGRDSLAFLAFLSRKEMQCLNFMFARNHLCVLARFVANMKCTHLYFLYFLYFFLGRPATGRYWA